MISLSWQPILRLLSLLKAPPLNPMEHERRVKLIERNVVLPVKLIFTFWIGWSFYSTQWFMDAGVRRSIAMEVMHTFFLGYATLTVAGGILLVLPRRWPFPINQWVVFITSFVDSFFVASLLIVVGGFDGILYWLLPGLIVRNAACIPLARQQILLNFSVVVAYVLTGTIDMILTRDEILNVEDSLRRALDIALPDNPIELFLTRIIILLLFAACCYGVQVVFENERRLAEESRESASRQEQLRAAGRMAAEIAHKIKNPLGIINNAAFSLQRAIEQGRVPPIRQVEIIREEVTRSDRIITDMMGYAQLAEGQVEKLNVTIELNRAIIAVFPPGAPFSVQVHTDFAANLPPLLMQRTHFCDIIVNLLTNAREALGGIGQVSVRAWAMDDVVFISIKDDGPGIPREKQEKVFESYFSTKEKGTGLGLSIVRHNIEMYQGRVSIESTPGEGACFLLEFPTRTFMKKRK